MIGKMLYLMRQRKHLSQDELADILGIARNTISQYETGKIQPTFEMVQKIAQACDFAICFENGNTGDQFQPIDVLNDED
ncbi:MAG: helix-turn-helix transcriptional regulator [Bacilli bacterium]|nr:helix-turn-helix transcriptional regulator [Bacilli bacterium]